MLSENNSGTALYMGPAEYNPNIKRYIGLAYGETLRMFGHNHVNTMWWREDPLKAAREKVVKNVPIVPSKLEAMIETEKNNLALLKNKLKYL